MHIIPQPNHQPNPNHRPPRSTKVLKPHDWSQELREELTPTHPPCEDLKSPVPGKGDVSKEGNPPWKTNIFAPENGGPLGSSEIPNLETIHFQGRLLSVSGSVTVLEPPQKKNMKKCRSFKSSRPAKCMGGYSL